MKRWIVLRRNVGIARTAKSKRSSKRLLRRRVSLSSKRKTLAAINQYISTRCPSSNKAGVLFESSWRTCGLLVQSKNASQQSLDSLFRGVSSICGIGRVRIASNAIVFICEWPVCRRIDDCPERFFLQHAMRCLCIPRDNGSRLKPGIIEGVPRIGVLGQLNLRSRLFETLDIGSAGSSLNVVI
jgi:hypothetical protein